MELFDAVEAYRATLRPSRSATATNVKRKINWVLWHDPRRVEKRCCTQIVQRAIHRMGTEEAFAWQWLLRHYAPGLNAAPGRAWVKQAKQRLAPIAQEEFMRRLEEWFRFPETAFLTPGGSAMLRLLVWYASLVDDNRSLPIVARAAHVCWVKREPANKVIAALAWLLRERESGRFEQEVRKICKEWVHESSEVQRLQAARFPEEAQTREMQKRVTAAERK